MQKKTGSTKNSFPLLKGPFAGVTLVELMIAVAISGFVIAAIYMSYKAQQRASFIQDEVASMQQNARAALSVMEDDIRMAGYDPLGSSGATIESANATLIHFTMDLDRDGNVTESGENIVYSLYTSGSISTLGRKPNGTGSSNSAVAENIDYLEFRYLDDNGTVLTAPVATTDDIKNIVISILAASRTEDPDYTNDTVYKTASDINPLTGDDNGTATYQDGYRRRMFYGAATSRNMGI